MDGIAQNGKAWGGDEITLTLEEFTERYIRPAVRQLLDDGANVPVWFIAELNEGEK